MQVVAVLYVGLLENEIPKGIPNSKGFHLDRTLSNPLYGESPGFIKPVSNYFKCSSFLAYRVNEQHQLLQLCFYRRKHSHKICSYC